MLKPTVLEGSKAGHLGNRNFIVATGTSIPCALETALSSDQPGFASCVITRDVLSDNGRVVLMEKGTRSEEHTSELQSLMRLSYAVFCLKKKNRDTNCHT